MNSIICIGIYISRTSHPSRDMVSLVNWMIGCPCKDGLMILKYKLEAYKPTSYKLDYKLQVQVQVQVQIQASQLVYRYWIDYCYSA